MREKRNHLFLQRQYEARFVTSTNNMISEMSFSQNEEESLFTHPEQVEQLREQLIVLERHNKLTQPPLTLLQQPLAALFDPQFSTTFPQNAPQRLIARLQECEDQHYQLRSYLTFLGQLTSKMIDFIQEVQQRHREQSQAFQNEIEYLHQQVDSLTHKNQTIEGDVETFRQQLMAAQSQLIEIEREIGGEDQRQEQQFQKQRQIQILERQLQKISEQLQFYKFKSTRTESVASIRRPSLMSNCSERAIGYWRRPSGSTVPIQEQIETLKEQINILQQENQKLKLQLKQLYESKAVRDEDIQGLRFDDIKEQLNKQNPLGLTQFYGHQVDQNQYDHITLAGSNSIGAFNQSNKFVEITLHTPQHVGMSQSSSKFHTLSNEWSLKTLEASLTHFKFSSRPDGLIYLEDEKQNNRIPQTGETENSVPDSERITHRLPKIKSNIGVNTDQEMIRLKTQTSQQTEDELHQIQGDFSLFKRFASSFVNLRTLAVRERLNKPNHNKTNK